MREMIGIADVERFAETPAQEHDPGEVAQGHGQDQLEENSGRPNGRHDKAQALDQADKRERERERDVSAVLTHLPTGTPRYADTPITPVPNGLMRKQPLPITVRHPSLTMIPLLRATNSRPRRPTPIRPIVIKHPTTGCH